MDYEYVAYKDTGEVVKGKLSAASEQAANELLDFAGYEVVSLKPFEEFFNPDKLFGRWLRVKPNDIILFYRQLALLLESGLDIVTSLELLQGQASSRTLARVLREVISDLRAGNQLSVALNKHPEAFSPIHCRSLKVGEQTGNLEVMLRNSADHMERDLNSAKSIKSALTLPAITLVVAFVVVGVMVTFILPSFNTLYSSLDVELPLLTKILTGTGQWLKSNGLYVVLVMLAVLAVLASYIKTPNGKYNWHNMILKLPLIGKVSLLNELARSCRNISLLFRAGLPLTETLPLVIQSSTNTVISQAFAGVQRDMLKGEGLSQPMTKNPIFLPLMVQMVKVGEETGRLDATLFAVTQNYETEAQDKTSQLIGLIQPLVTLIVGGIVGFIAISMVSAMYSIYGQLG
ncbi:type II secretion system F family protein [Chloroflexota bacterium]